MLRPWIIAELEKNRRAREQVREERPHLDVQIPPPAERERRDEAPKGPIVVEL